VMDALFNSAFIHSNRTRGPVLFIYGNKAICCNCCVLVTGYVNMYQRAPMSTDRLHLNLGYLNADAYTIIVLKKANV